LPGDGGRAMPVFIDTVAWVRLENGRILCAATREGCLLHSRGKARRRGKRSANPIDELAWFSYADRPRVPHVDQMLFDDLKATGALH
jgi:hypothetical protein